MTEARRKTRPLLFAFNGQEYFTLKDIRSECRQRLAQYPFGYQGRLAKDDADWFVSLVKERHYKASSLLSKQIDGIELYLRFGQSSNHLQIVYQDGSCVPFSWAQCCTLKKQPSERRCVNSALRLAVADQVVEELDRVFENRFLIVCPMTHKVLCRAQVHVDHAPPCFADIVSRWLIKEQLDLSHIQVRDYEHGGWCMACDDQEKSWADFHRKHANLRVVCKEWNMKAGRHT